MNEKIITTKTVTFCTWKKDLLTIYISDEGKKPEVNFHVDSSIIFLDDDDFLLLMTWNVFENKVRSSIACFMNIGNRKYLANNFRIMKACAYVIRYPKVGLD